MAPALGDVAVARGSDPRVAPTWAHDLPVAEADPRAETAVRRAVPGDAAGIGRVQVDAWPEAYTGRMPQSILDGRMHERATRTCESVNAGGHPYHGGRDCRWPSTTARSGCVPLQRRRTPERRIRLGAPPHLDGMTGCATELYGTGAGADAAAAAIRRGAGIRLPLPSPVTHERAILHGTPPAGME